MKSNYKKLGQFIRQVDVRNTEGKEDNLLGVSVQKMFIPSIANTVGTDFTKYKVVKRGFQTSLLEVELITGKSHQIRAQSSHIGYPIVGDTKYGEEDINDKFRVQMKVKSQLLCAYKVVIDHKEYKIDCDFEQYVR